MALHGTVEINGHVLYDWSARRASDKLNKVNDYHVVLTDMKGWSASTVGVTTLTHAYDDGALALAAKVLAWASTYSAEEA